MVDEGKMKGNMLTPTVAIIPTIDAELHTKARRVKRASINASIAPRRPIAGASIVIGMI